MSYNPQADTSPGRKATDKTGPILVLTGKGDSRLCRCGCGHAVAPKRNFRQGHDAKLKGILVRAHNANSPVTVEVDGKAHTRTPAAVAAAYLNGYTLGDTPASKRKAGPKLGDSRRVKVGRWVYNGKITAVADNGMLTVAYSTAKGSRKTVLVAA